MHRRWAAFVVGSALLLAGCKAADAGGSAVVLYDPRRDFAVLRVPGLAAPGLDFDRTGTSGDDADVASGISGAPLLATNGGVHGMVFASDIEERGSGYALTAQEISAPAEEGRTRTRQVSTSGCAG